MAQVTLGFDSNINEATMSEIMALVGAELGVVAGPSDWLVSAVPGARQVTVNPGAGLHAFVKVTTDDAPVLNLSSPPAGGRWALIVARRDWELNSCVFVPLTHSDTAAPAAGVDGTPLTHPVTMPAGYRADPGALLDQPLAWAWTNSATTEVLLWDVREAPLRSAPIDGDERLLGSSAIRPFSSAPVGIDGLVVTHGGPSPVIQPVTVTVLDPTPVTIEVSLRWIARGIGAGTNWISVDGSQVGPAQRVHNQGYASIPQQNTYSVRTTLLPGTHVIALRCRAEPGGVDRIVVDPLVNVWRD